MTEITRPSQLSVYHRGSIESFWGCDTMDGIDNLSHIRGVRADQTHLKWLDCCTAIFAVLLVLLSIGMFLLDKNSREVSGLIEQQNAAALKLEENVKYYHWVHDGDNGLKTQLFPPGLFDDLVDFSRNNAKIIYTIHRLPFWRSWWGGSQQSCPSDMKWCSVPLHVIQNFGSDFNHIVVDPAISPDPHDPAAAEGNIVSEGYYQIRLYQNIRDYAQDDVDTWRSLLLAISTYILPIAYALLGALFYALRHPLMPRILNRLVIAGVAGFAVSRFNALLPQDVLLPPLAIAFVVGYSTEILVQRLDHLLHSKRSE